MPVTKLGACAPSRPRSQRKTNTLWKRVFTLLFEVIKQSLS